MKLGIPTLNNHAGVTKLIESAEAGSVQPSEYIVIDNGLYPYVPPVLPSDRTITVLRYGRNQGVPASWNKVFEYAEATFCSEVAISNDDIVFGPDTFRLLSEAIAHRPFVGACGGWALFAQTLSCWKAVGPYDEHFYPAYYEDCDYLLRMQRAGFATFDIGFAGAEHGGEVSTKHANDADRTLIAEGRQRNYAYFVTKWGTDSPRWGDPHVKNYDVPFNGRLLKSEVFSHDATEDRTRIAPMRYDVLNAIAKKLGAERYLEIGVSDGDCIRRIHVAEKWGVDPAPQLSGVSGASVFIPRTSDYFFEHIAPSVGRFDLIFIDGDHKAEQVYREVLSALKCLTPRGVICLHDCNPHTEAMQEVPHRTGWQWTGDVWKAVARLRHEGVATVRVIPSDFGIGLVIPYSTPDRLELPAEWDRLLYRDLVAHREILLGLLRPGEWEDFLDRSLPRP